MPCSVPSADRDDTRFVSFISHYVVFGRKSLFIGRHGGKKLEISWGIQDQNHLTTGVAITSHFDYARLRSFDVHPKPPEASMKLQKLTIVGVALICSLPFPFHSAAAEPPGDAKIVEKTPGLVAFWTFGEEAGASRASTGTKEKHALTEVNGPIERVEGGPYSGHSAAFNGKQWMQIKHGELGDLNISGPDAQVSMFAVVFVNDVAHSRTIAGIWSEGKGAHDDTGTRQYALLAHMPAYGGNKRLTPHISAEGGVTRRKDGNALPWNADYAATNSEVPEKQWCTLGFTYDSKYIRAYINGKLDARTLDAKKDRREDSYFLTEGPDGKDRGMNPYFHGRGIFRYAPEKHAKTRIAPSDFTVGARYAGGSMLSEPFRGRFGALAVFNRALTDEEMQTLHDSAHVDKLKP